PGPGSDVSVHKQSDNTTVPVSAPASGAAVGPAESTFPALSGDGRFVAFSSSATDLVPGDTNGWSDVFVRDLQTKTTTRISAAPGGAEGDDFSSFPCLSAIGRLVAFSSEATNLVAGGDTNGKRDAFVYDRETGTMTRVSVGTGGEANDDTGYPIISGNGRYVAFASKATN